MQELQIKEDESQNKTPDRIHILIRIYSVTKLIHRAGIVSSTEYNVILILSNLWGPNGLEHR